MMGCLLLAVLLIFAVLVPPLGIPLLLLVLVVMIVVFIVRGSSQAAGSLLSRPPDPAAPAAPAAPSERLLCAQCGHTIRQDDDYTWVGGRALHIRCPEA